MTIYKVLDGRNHSCHGGRHTWKPGEWTPKVDPQMCRLGYHLCADEAQLVKWLDTAIWRAEARGDVEVAHDKICVESARITERIDTWTPSAARLFACDCLQHVLFACDDPWDRPRIAIETARAFEAGAASIKDLTYAFNTVCLVNGPSAVFRALRRGASFVVGKNASDIMGAFPTGVYRPWQAKGAADCATTIVARVVCNSKRPLDSGAIAYAAIIEERRWQGRRLKWYLDGCPLPVPFHAEMAAPNMELCYS